MTNAENKGLFAGQEEQVLEFWDRAQTFEKSVTKPAPQGSYVFYDGPPFATGTPHYGHLVASLMKDAIPRFWTMKGYTVERRWGWDCHGLPIENIVEKELGSKSKKDIEAMGVDKFNEACRARVLEYAEEWRATIKRLGRWVDMDNSYRTMDKDYMESVWWVFKNLYDKGLIYEGYRSMHICPRCETTLSQSEVAEGYKDIKDLSTIAKFKLRLGQTLAGEPVDENCYILAWTTTPWTLIGNVALAVGAEINYTKIRTADSTNSYILAQDRLSTVMAGQEYEIVANVKGAELVGLSYEPLFDYYLEDARVANRENGWKVYAAEFVTTEEGTGVVHIAPAFGEDDLNLGKAELLPFIQHIGMDGIIKAEAGEFAGLSVKPLGDHSTTDVAIIKYLAAKNLLFAKAKYEHSYPHCWRCDTPLLNYATSSWFVKVTDLKPQALETAAYIRWSPEHIKEGRFGQWLAGARDWSISRQRFWASVIPIWKCPECAGLRVFGSATELEEASGQKIEDLHKHIVDKITLPCSSCNGTMLRIPDVLDTWFDSASMPYAQLHYPFANQEKLENNFPAEFIAEGVDQTRAWFYYLHVVSNGVMGKHCFKNVVVNGICLAEDGKKMSKKLKNYPDPNLVLDKYGADALRLYLLASPVMQAENLNVSEKGMEEALRKNIMLLNNIYNFYATYAGEMVESSERPESVNVLDNWLLLSFEQLVNETTLAMEQYNMPKAVRPITEFINDFSTWYLRRSRDRLKDSSEAVATMRYVFIELAKIMAPFAPFIAETIWQRASGYNFADVERSVHLEDWPQVPAAMGIADQQLLADMATARQVVEIGLAARDAAKLKIRQPLAGANVSNCTLAEAYQEIIKEELNLKSLQLEAGLGDLSVELDTQITEELRAEGLERDLVRQLNLWRKDAGLTINDRVSLYYNPSDEIASFLAQRAETIIQAVLADGLQAADAWPEGALVKEITLGDLKFALALKKIDND
ncbi:MAG: isoleucine--tRNA ligase [Candidatus Falkowbacteria bacterium]